MLEAGAAKFASLLSVSNCTVYYPANLLTPVCFQGMGPKVMIVEEAGQVLESHILASLVESVQHVILIGDPEQLRPIINCYREYRLRYLF